MNLKYKRKVQIDEYPYEMEEEDKKLFTTKPAKWFTSGEPREITIISSTKAKKVIETGVDDDIDVFK